MKITTKKLKFAWKYRRPLWKYRNLVRYRHEIAVAAVVSSAIAAGILIKRCGIQSLSAERKA